MPLGVRDVLMIVRAQDLASRELGNIGRSLNDLGSQGGITGQDLLGVGAGIAAVGAATAGLGAAGLGFFNSMKNSAMEYNQQAALTLTQVDQVGVSLEQIKDIGRTVAAEIPAPFKQLQASLFDIFSSMDVTVGQSQTILEEFAKGAVAGQVDVQTAGRATIALMNAYKVPVEDVSKVMDIQFQLVRKGVGTYDEFATTIGRAIPSAVKAGASMEDLAGALAFETRNGLSAAMASTSVARAFDLLSNPVFKTNMHDFGIEVADASGNFRPMVDVVTDLKNKLSGLSESERADKLKELTTGAGGTIQAMRFLNLAVTDSNGLLGELTSNMNDSAGAMDKAYDIMAVQPQSKLEALKNKWEVFKTELGDRVMPVFDKILTVGSSILSWFDRLSDHTKDMIVKWGLILSVGALVGGLLLVIAGALLMFVGAIALVVGSVGGAIAIIGGFVAALVAIIALIALFVTNGGSLSDVLRDIMRVSQQVVQTLQQDWQAALTYLTNIWNNIKGNVQDMMNVLFQTVSEIGGDIVNWWNNSGIPEAAAAAWQSVVDAVSPILGKLQEAVEHVMNAIAFVVRIVLDIVLALWHVFGDDILNVVKIIFEWILKIVTDAINIVADVIKFVLDLINGDWGKAWGDLLDIFARTWDAIYNTLKSAVELIGTVLHGLYELVVGVFKNAGEWLFDIGKQIIMGLIHGIESVLGDLKDKLTNVGKDIVSWKGPPAKDAVMLKPAGQLLIQGLMAGIQDQQPALQATLNTIVGDPQFSPTTIMTGPPSTGSQSVTINVQPGAVQVSLNGASGDDMATAEEHLNNFLFDLVRQAQQT